MNWLSQKKIFTYFYNKFRPVNRIHYIKYGVNSSLLTILVAAEGLRHLGSLFYHDTLFTIGVIYKFPLVWYSTKQGTTHRPTSHLAHLYTVPFLWPWEEYRQQCSWVDDFAGQCSLWQLSRQHFLIPSQCQQPKFHWWLPPWVWFFFLAIAIDTYNGLPYLHSFVWPGTVAVT